MLPPNRRREINERVARCEMPDTMMVERIVSRTNRLCGTCKKLHMVLVRGRGVVSAMCVKCDLDKQPDVVKIIT